MKIWNASDLPIRNVILTASRTYDQPDRPPVRVAEFPDVIFVGPRSDLVLTALDHETYGATTWSRSWKLSFNFEDTNGIRWDRADGARLRCLTPPWDELDAVDHGGNG